MQKTSSKTFRILSIMLSLCIMLSTFVTLPVYAERSGLQTLAEEIIKNSGNNEIEERAEKTKHGEFILQETPVSSASGTIYFVDATGGNDNNDGKSEEAAWKSIEKVNSMTFKPGDKILFKAGEVWENVTLHPKGSGEKDKRITIGSYGDGPLPKLVGNATVSDVVYFYNQEYWEISNLDISNKAAGFTGTKSSSNGNKLGDYRGIHITGQDAGQLNGFWIHDCYIHDITGEVRWIGGSGSAEPGTSYGNGWDASKRTGGIVFEILKPSTSTPTTFNDILIEKNVMIDNSFGSIIIKQWNGTGGTFELWAQRDNGKDHPEYYSPTWAPHTNITIRENYINHDGSDYACNTIYLTSVKGGLVERNVSIGAGVCGIEMYYADDIVVQYNEVAYVRAKAGGTDSNGIDPDKQATNIYIQYNYIHDTGDGILLCGFVFGTATVRYNVIKNATKNYINPHADKGLYLVYNNIFYNTLNKSNIPFVNSSGGNGTYLTKSACIYKFYNNIFYNTSTSVTSATIGEGVSTVYSNNCYHGPGVTAATADPNPITADPRFVGAIPEQTGTAESGPILNMEGLYLDSESPLIDAGKVIDNNGGVDFAGKGLYDGDPDIGIFENDSGNPAGTKTVTGYVFNRYGDPVEGAVVMIDNNPGLTGITSSTGYFSVPAVPYGIYDIIAAHPDYEDGLVTNFEVALGVIASTRITLGKYLHAINVENVDINPDTAKIKVGESVQLTAVISPENATDKRVTWYSSNSMVAIVSNDGVVTGVNNGVAEITATSVDGGIKGTCQITVTGERTYYLYDDFNSYELGDFNGSDKWGFVGNRNISSIKIEEDPHDTSNKALFLAKSQSDNMGVYNKDNLNATGVITLETRIMRTEQGSSANQFGIYTYNAAGWRADTPTSSTNVMITAFMSKNQIGSHNVRGSSSTVNAGSYSLNKWYDIRIVANLETDTYDFYIDGELKLKEQPIRTASDTLDRVMVFSSTTNYGNLYVDYIRIYAGYPTDIEDEVTYTVTYDANGGSGPAPVESDKKEGEVFRTAKNTFTAPEGMKFKEWNTRSDGQGTAYSEDEEITMGAADLVLYAIWERAQSSLIVTNLTGADTVNVGDTVILTLEVDGAVDISAFDIILSYDSESFELIEAQPYEGLTVWVKDDRNSVHVIMGIEGEANKIDGYAQILDFKFRAKDFKKESLFALVRAKMADINGNETDAELSGKIIKMTVDKRELISKIDTVKNVLSNAIEGTEVGQYPSGSKERLQAALYEAEAVRDDNSKTQDEVNAAVVKLTEALTFFEKLVITTSTGDFNEDCEVNLGDLGIAARYYGVQAGDENWSVVSKFDIDGDNRIGIYEMAFIALKLLGK